MSLVALIYFSQTDFTHKLAASVVQGCESITGASVMQHRIIGEEIEQGRFRQESCLELIDQSDAVIFGSPTYMGGPAAQFKAFADATSERWERQLWSGKLAAGFTDGANANGDQLATIQYFSILAAQHGMLWIGLDIAGGMDEQGLNPLGSQLGLTAHAVAPEPAPLDIKTARYFGARVAGASRRVTSPGTV